MPKKVVIRVDSSRQIGTGHLMRCLNLAMELRAQKIEVTFISRELVGNNIKFLSDNHFDVNCLPPTFSGWVEDAAQTVDVLNKLGDVYCLVVDNYFLDIQWEQVVHPFVKKILVIDDLADRQHDCEFLLDQNFYFNKESRYKDLLPTTCLQLLGPEYALLKSDFPKYRNTLRHRDGAINRILISFGGSDETNETAKALTACTQLEDLSVRVDVVVGASCPHQQSLINQCANLPNVYYHCQIDNMAELMVNADLAIGAGGITTWERCCLGLPSVVITNATHQETLISALFEQGAIRYLGRADEVGIEQIKQIITDLLSMPEKLQTMSAVSREIVDGNGCKKVVEHLLMPVNSLKIKQLA